MQFYTVTQAGSVVACDRQFWEEITVLTFLEISSLENYETSNWKDIENSSGSASILTTGTFYTPCTNTENSLFPYSDSRRLFISVITAKYGHDLQQKPEKCEFLSGLAICNNVKTNSCLIASRGKRNCLAVVLTEQKSPGLKKTICTKLRENTYLR